MRNRRHDDGIRLRAVIECKYHLGGTADLLENAAGYIPADSLNG